MARVDAEFAALVHHLAILDHAAFREHDDLAATQDVHRQHFHQVRMVVGYHAQVAQQLCEAIVAGEERAGGDGAAEIACFAVDQVLRDERLHAREVIEQKYLAMIDLALFVMHLDAQAEHFAHLVEGARAPIVGLLVQIEVIVHVACRARAQETCSRTSPDG
jgi:hypothetical protein